MMLSFEVLLLTILFRQLLSLY